MIGDMRTDALHAALRDEPIDDGRLIALLVLAFAGKNVEVKSGIAREGIHGDGRATIAGTLTEGEVITSDPAAVRSAARAMLAYALSCRDNWSQSGAVARIAGDAIGADSHLPNMATQEFLSSLSKGRGAGCRDRPQRAGAAHGQGNPRRGDRPRRRGTLDLPTGPVRRRRPGQGRAARPRMR